MIHLRRGDRLPAVAIVQTILNELGPSSTTRLRVDGQFGAETAAEVRAFKRAHNLGVDDFVDPRTWSVIAQQSQCAIVDIVDLAYVEILRVRGGPRGLQQFFAHLITRSNPGVTEDQALRRAAAETRKLTNDARYNTAFYNRMRALGGDPIPVYTPRRAYEEIMNGLKQRASSSRIVLLRFQGHGGTEAQGIAGSLGGTTRFTFNAAAHWALTAEDDALGIIQSGSRLLGDTRNYMTPWGAVELHGCHVAGRRERGRIVANRANMQAMADFFLLPVSGSPASQSWSDAEALGDYRLEGEVVTAFPIGSSLEGWYDLVQSG